MDLSCREHGYAWIADVCWERGQKVCVWTLEVLWSNFKLRLHAWVPKYILGQKTDKKGCKRGSIYILYGESHSLEGIGAASQNWWLEIPKSLEIRDFGFRCSWNQGDWPMPSNFLLTNGKYVVRKFRWILSLFQYDLYQTKQKRVQIKLNINLYPYSIIIVFDNQTMPRMAWLLLFHSLKRRKYIND